MSEIGPVRRAKFDLSIGGLDRALSEFLGLFKTDLDQADLQTLKHHADDLIGVGEKMHYLLETRLEKQKGVLPG